MIFRRATTGAPFCTGSIIATVCSRSLAYASGYEARPSKYERGREWQGGFYGATQELTAAAGETEYADDARFPRISEDKMKERTVFTQRRSTLLFED